MKIHLLLQISAEKYGELSRLNIPEITQPQSPFLNPQTAVGNPQYSYICPVI
jgi:hypothetical protein